MKALVEKYFRNKKTLILGFGREGKESLKTIKKYLPDSNITIADKNETINLSDEIFKNYTNINLSLGEGYANNINNFDIIVKSPGIPEHVLKNVDKRKITSQTDLFLQKYSNKTIGVTGTKGKSTTSSLINHILKCLGYKSVLLGNIGIPAFSILNDIDDETILVVELSAHQLKYIKNSPKVGVVLNIFPEHLDHFISFEDYYLSKYNIFKYQNKNDVSIFGSPCPNLDSILKNKNNKQISIDRLFNQHKEILYSYIPHIKLKGEHNLINVCAAVSSVNNFLGEDKVNFDDLLSILKSFNPLPHRLEFVGNYNTIDFYNDSISTIPQAAIAAVKTLKNVSTIILGGYDRGIDYNDLVNYLLNNDDIKNIFLLGKAGDRMYELFKNKGDNLCLDNFIDIDNDNTINISNDNKIDNDNTISISNDKKIDNDTITNSRIKKDLVNNTTKYKNIIKCINLEDAVRFAFELTPNNTICLLSPAASSYDSFKNFEERGNVFKKLILDYSK